MRIIRTTLVSLIATLAVAAPAFAHEGYDGTTSPPPCEQQQSTQPIADASNFGGSGTQESCPQPAQPAPTGQAPLFQRVYRFGAEVNGFDSGVLDVTIDRPNGYAAPGYVLVGERTRIYDADGVRVSSDVLDDADSVLVAARLLRFRDWMHDEDGNPVPTFRAKRLRIIG